MKKPHLLLTPVFKPYGIDNKYADGVGMQMETLANQITREQGVHSLRANFWTFNLYFLAENISTRCTVLDFPSWNRFKKELKTGKYTHVGITFIQANALKARRMTKYIRKHHPDIKIIIGGYGTMISHIDKLVPHDELVEDEGVLWLRKYFGESTDRPIDQPLRFTSTNNYTYGYKHPEGDPVHNSVTLFPGLGCKNGCFFCSTSHKFNCKYHHFLKTGKDIFDWCRECERRYNTKKFGYQDENFLKDPKRAKELQIEMEKHMRPYMFAFWSSAETIVELGIDFLVRHGVTLVWIGIESKESIFEKVDGIDVKKLIKDLQAHGISVISSSILYLEHHDEKSLEEDIEWAISMESDWHQFLNLFALHGTPLFEKFKNKGMLVKNYNIKHLHGQHDLNFVHPKLGMPNAKDKLTEAFRRYYQANGPGILSVAITMVQGYLKAEKDFKERQHLGLVWNPKTLKYEKSENPKSDEFMRVRVEVMKKHARGSRPVLLPAKVFAPNKKARDKARKAEKLFRKAFGPPTAKETFLSWLLLASATVESVKIWLHELIFRRELIRQPPTAKKEYNVWP